MTKRITRRSFLRSSAALAGAAVAARLTGAPAILAEGSPNSKLGMVLIGCGGRGTAAHLPECARERLVAVVDADEARAASALKFLKDNAGKFKLADLDPSKVKIFTDYRRMFDEIHKEIDAVVVATPDHQHACPSMMAIKLGKGVYCEKPLTHTIHEARALAEAARRHKVATQMGNQGHSSEEYRRLCEFIWAGAIGNVTEVHCCTNRPGWPQGISARPPGKPVPAGLHWDEWIGPAPFRDYHDGLHSFKWRGWWDFGCGALGDMACHIMDGAFWALKLGYPTGVECLEASDPVGETFPRSSVIRWDFPARGEMPPVKVFWYDGGKKPKPPKDLEPGRKLDNNGYTFYIGDKGAMYTGCYGGGVRIVPETKYQEYVKEHGMPEKTIPRSGGYHKDFLDACKGGKPASSNFDYAGPLTETVLIGNLSLKAGAGKKLEWDAPNMKVTNLSELDQYVRYEYRKSWTL